jgi:ribonuclease Z
MCDAILASVVLDVAMVGTGGTMPLPNRWLSSVLLRYGQHRVLFDCGEGTQISLRALGWGLKDIDLILISHAHADHITGLAGLLLTQANSARTAAVHIVGPRGFAAVVAGLLVVAPHLPFAVRCTELAPEGSIDLDALKVTCTAAEHHVPCLAYRVDVPRGRQFLPDRARALGIPVADWRRLQRGEAAGDFDPADVLGPPRSGLSVGLVTDTRPTDAIAALVSGVDLLVCEGTFGSDDDQPRAVERTHMTFREAAQLAQRANAKQLVLTHFSPSIVDPEAFVQNARDVFPDSVVARDHLTFSLRFAAE